jgi:hypothetical protein
MDLYIWGDAARSNRTASRGLPKRCLRLIVCAASLVECVDARNLPRSSNLKLNEQGVSMHLYLLYLIYGWGIATWVLMLIIWRPDPPPSWLGTYLLISVAGILGGVGGGLAAAAVESNPMPGIVAALAGASILVGIARAVSGATTAAR